MVDEMENNILEEEIDSVRKRNGSLNESNQHVLILSLITQLLVQIGEPFKVEETNIQVQTWNFKIYCCCKILTYPSSGDFITLSKVLLGRNQKIRSSDCSLRSR